MKKILSIIMLGCLIISSCFSSVLANARWENSKSIRTYIEPNDKKALMKEAFAKWTQATNGKIVFKYINSSNDAQIVVNFVKDASKTSKMEHAAGVTYHRSIGDRMIFARIEIADNAPSGAAFRKEALYKIMVHEIGHAIGMFDHSQNPMSIMYYAKGSRNQSLTSGDLKFLGRIYGW